MFDIVPCRVNAKIRNREVLLFGKIKRMYPATKNGARPNDRGEIEIVRSGGGKLTPPSAG